jgi:hypothetical protein
MISLGQGQYKVMHLRGLCSAADIVVRDGLVAIPDVFCNGGVEKVGVLRYHRDVITEVVDLDIAEFVEADSDGTIGGFVQTLEESGERGLAGARGANDCDALAVVDGEAEVPENGNLWSPGVEEVDVVEIDSTCEFRADDTLGFVSGRNVELEKPVEVARSLSGLRNLLS